MADVLLRNLDPEMLTRLRAAARAHHRSLQAQIQVILEDADRLDCAQTLRMSKQWMRYWKRQGKVFSDSTELIREDRDTR